MDRLNEKERIEFISKHISAEIALEATGYNDSSRFLRKVSAFCKDCLNGDYYIEPEYDDYYYDDISYDNMDESEWADKFTEYLKLAVMYSMNKNYDVSSQAFDVAVKMFCSDSNIYYPNTSHDLYKRARFFAQKLDNINTFVYSMQTHILSHKRYDSVQTLLTILSFEGRTEKLIETALKSDGYSRHDYLKYTSKSLIYRAVGHEQVSLPDLKEYIESIEGNKIPGIVDMIRLPEDSEIKVYLLSSAVKILKIMVKFHIDAATRLRYQRAAYYCAVIKDIHTYTGKKNEFIEYYGDIMRENNRRPALKDEMKRKIGYN